MTMEVDPAADTAVHVRMTHRETHDCLLSVLNLCNNFIGPVSNTLRGVRAALRSVRGAMERASLRVSPLDDAVQVIENAVSQLDKLNRAMRKYYSVQMPECEPTDGSEPIARAIREMNVISYNMRPAVTRFGAPATVGGVRSWEALRQPADYLAFVKAGVHGDWLCRVVCSESAVRLVGAHHGQPVDVPPHARLRWLGRNIEVTLRTGVKSYAAVFVTDRAPPPPKPDKEEFAAWYEALLDLNWPKASVDRYLKFHGELPQIA